MPFHSTHIQALRVWTLVLGKTPLLLASSLPNMGALLKHALFTLLLSSVYADLTAGVPDAAPAGSEEWISPLVTPAPDVKGPPTGPPPSLERASSSRS
ncbi:hypothetical protein C8F01DRAFT_1266684 [Mycena amicta]|nr:hypothetical protein C8F01DRAFT_1266684 [Mycena amicta]